jgi:protein SCO1
MKHLSKIFFVFVAVILFVTALTAQQVKIGIDEKLGATLPMNLQFRTSDGKTVSLNDIMNKPTLLALVYYECPSLCNPMQSELAWTIDKLQLEPGIDYQVVSISFDHKENSAIAAKWKTSYLKSIKRNIKPEDWVFLTGDSASIQKLTKTVGYHFKPYREQFNHASTIISISPEGKVCRYLFGTQFNPFDVKMALLEAKAGKTSPTISKLLQYCFSYDPSGRLYTLNITRIIGTIMLLCIGTFAAVLILKKKKIKRVKGVDIDG